MDVLGPVRRIASKFAAHPDRCIADFGCGEGLLQEALPDVQIIGLDHVAWSEHVIACDKAALYHLECLPYLHCVVLAARGDATAIGRPCDGVDDIEVSSVGIKRVA